MSDIKPDEKTLALLTVISQITGGRNTVSYLTNLYETSLKKIQEDRTPGAKPINMR